MELLLETPLPSLKDAEEALLQNNLALQASKYGTEATQLSQKLNFVSQICRIFNALINKTI